MPSNSFALEPGGPKRLVVSWGMGWKNFTIQLDGKEIGRIDGGMKAIKEGRSLSLPDGSNLDIKLQSGSYGQLPSLVVLRDGKALPGSGGDPATKLKTTYQLIYIIAGLNIILGLIAEIGRIPFLRDLGVGWFSVIAGIVYAVLGYFVSQRSRAALVLTIGLLVLDTIAGLLLISASRGNPAYGGLFARGFFLIWLWQGFKAIDAVEAEPASRTS
jgi:hypothetical protein